jgi:hypothetical protein
MSHFYSSRHYPAELTDGFVFASKSVTDILGSVYEFNLAELPLGESKTGKTLIINGRIVARLPVQALEGNSSVRRAEASYRK